MSDLIERMETHGHCNARDGCTACDLLKEARVALKQTQAEIERLENRLEIYLFDGDGNSASSGWGKHGVWNECEFCESKVKIAKQALDTERTP